MWKNRDVSQRDAYWDNMKGALILLVLFMHIVWAQQSKNYVNKIIDCSYLFLIPAFAFFCGCAGRDRRMCGFEAIARLLLLYFIFNSIAGFCFGTASLMTLTCSYWFLLALAAWRTSAPYLARIKHIQLFLLCAAIVAGFYDTVEDSFTIGKIIGFYPFYMAGYLLPQERAEAVIHQRYRTRAVKAVMLALAAAAIAIFACKYFHYGNTALFLGAYAVFPLDVLGRLVLFAVATLMILALRYGSPDRTLPFLTRWGRNALWIYLFQLPLTVLFRNRIGISCRTTVLFVLAALGALLICLVFGSDRLAGLLNRFAGSLTGIFAPREGERAPAIFARLAIALVCLGYVAQVLTGPLAALSSASNDGASGDVLYPVMTADQQQHFDDAFHITFAGDLILLEDQVKRAYREGGCDFSPVFEYAKKYISSADYAIGVFEGPMAGEEAGYSSSNFADGKTLALNFPDTFASAVQDAGFDLVTTANNHMLDKGLDGAMRTLDVLDQIGLDHIGSYRDAEEKRREHIKLVEVDGIRMAFLAYTYGDNTTEAERLIDGDLFFLTSIASGTESRQVDKMKAMVEQDFAEVKALNPDLIIVLPHLGTQFINDPDASQKLWFDFFMQCGADIILGDHPHAVQPALIEEYGERSVFAAYCPGNFANVYREYGGDTSMLIDVYIDRNTKAVIGGSVVPLYTQSQIDGNFRALPIHDIVNDPALQGTLSTDDFDRAAEANRTITRVMFGKELDIHAVPERYYFDSNGLIRTKARGLALNDRMRNGVLYSAISDASSVCFVGDSVTEGTKNGGCPRYEPIEEFLGEREIFNYSLGSSTVISLTKRMENVPPPLPIST